MGNQLLKMVGGEGNVQAMGSLAISHREKEISQRALYQIEASHTMQMYEEGKMSADWCANTLYKCGYTVSEVNQFLHRNARVLHTMTEQQLKNKPALAVHKSRPSAEFLVSQSEDIVGCYAHTRFVDLRGKSREGLTRYMWGPKAEEHALPVDINNGQVEVIPITALPGGDWEKFSQTIRLKVASPPNSPTRASKEIQGLAPSNSRFASISYQGSRNNFSSSPILNEVPLFDNYSQKSYTVGVGVDPFRYPVVPENPVKNFFFSSLAGLVLLGGGIFLVWKFLNTWENVKLYDSTLNELGIMSGLKQKLINKEQASYLLQRHCQYTTEEAHAFLFLGEKKLGQA